MKVFANTVVVDGSNRKTFKPIQTARSVSFENRKNFV